MLARDFLGACGGCEHLTFMLDRCNRGAAWIEALVCFFLECHRKYKTSEPQQWMISLCGDSKASMGRIDSMHEPNVVPPSAAQPGRIRPPLKPLQVILRFAVIALVLLLIVLAFGYTGGWLAPHRLTAQRMVNQLQANAGVFPGYRRNHAKGVCVTGYFDSNGQAQPYSVAQIFAPGRTPVVGRFAVPVGNPYAPDSAAPIRSMAMRFALANGQQWRTGMNSMPVFPLPPHWRSTNYCKRSNRIRQQENPIRRSSARSLGRIRKQPRFLHG
jgi:hypothetical protein